MGALLFLYYYIETITLFMFNFLCDEISIS